MQFVIPVGKLASCSLLLLGLLASGCSKPSGEPTVKISGTVTYKGKPVPNVSVVFNPADGKVPGSAITDANGKFDSATTFQHGDGVVPGKHKVTLATVSSGEGMIESKDAYSAKPAGKLPFPSKYLNTYDTDAEMEIKGDKQVVDITLND